MLFNQLETGDEQEVNYFWGEEILKSVKSTL